MTRLATLLASAAVTAIVLPGFSAEAATCTQDPANTFTCTMPNSAPVASTADDVSVTVESGASVTSPNRDTTPLAFQGDRAVVVNEGSVAQTDPRNNGYAITGEGTGLSVTNRGTISSGDRAIEMLDGSGLTVVNEVGGTITSRRQGVRSGVPGATVENHGEIIASVGRALQLRGEGATVINHGLLEGGEEALEARGGFTLINRGTIAIGIRELGEPDSEGFRKSIGLPSDDPDALNGLPGDEDGVQFAGGGLDADGNPRAYDPDAPVPVGGWGVHNWGSITGTDDGVDIDEGVVHNYATGIIRSVGTGNAIDIDNVFEDEIVVRDNRAVFITNEGLIEGPRAISADEEAKNPVHIVNSGTLRGTSGIAIGLAPGQGDSSLTLFGNSLIFGDVLFGAGNDVLTIGAITSGSLINSVFDGGAGANTVVFDGFDLPELLSFVPTGDLVMLSLLAGGDVLSGPFRNFQSWVIGGQRYDTATLAALTVAPIPVPAALPLLATALGGLLVLRRRRA